MINRRKVLALLGLGALFPSALTATITDQEEQKAQQSMDNWKELPRFPVSKSSDRSTASLISASQQANPIPFYYFGGSSPRQLRLVSVESVFRHQNSPHTYINAYCHLRREHRVFRVDKISLA